MIITFQLKNQQMKAKMLILILFLCSMAGEQSLKAQSLVIRLQDGTENTEQLSAVRKLSFTASDMLLAFKSGSTDEYGLTTIQKLYFDTGTSATGNITAGEKTLTVFPNPAGNTITIGNFGKMKGTLSIYRSDGALMLQQEIFSETETMDVSGFQSGLYLIQANGRSAKFFRL